MKIVIWILLLLFFDVSFGQGESLEDKAIFLYNSGKTAQAIELLESIDSERALRLLINYLTWENISDKALKKIKLYEEKYGYNPEVTFRKAQLLAWKGKTTESRKLLKKLLKEKIAFFSDVVELIGFTYLWEGRREEAKFYLLWAYDLGKREPELLQALANLSEDAKKVSDSKRKTTFTDITEHTEEKKIEKGTVEFNVVLKGDSYYFSDSSNTKLFIGTFGAEMGINNFTLEVEGGRYWLDGEKGAIYGVYGKANLTPLRFKGGFKVYKGLKGTKFRKCNPFLEVKLKNSNYATSIGYEKALFGIYVRSKESYRRKIEADKYFFTLSTNFFNRNLWSDISVLDISDENLIVVPQFSYDLYYFNHIKSSIVPFIAGYYIFAKEQREIYYSPNFHDEELFGVNFKYKLTDHFYISLKPLAGYSFKDDTYIYSVGGQISYEHNRGNVFLFINRSNSAGKFSSYNYNELGLKGFIRW